MVAAILAAFIALLAPVCAFAHEVYVLPQETVSQALGMQPFSAWSVIIANADQFTLWALAAGLAVGVIFLASVSRGLERLLDPWLKRLPPYAPVVSRITIGLSFMAAAYYGALFGPELPLAATFGAAALTVRVMLTLAGLMITVGIYPRLAALAALGLFCVEAATHGWYLLTYTNYLGEIVVLLLLGAHILAVHTKHHDALRAPAWFLRAKRVLMPMAFPLLRVAFGISLIYASLYAKVLHNELALQVAYAYPDVVHFFGFEPHFLVLGAALVEICIGLFFVLGFEIRFASLFLLFWLSLSLWYFGEAVWPHLILIGIPVAFILYGYDKYSLEGRFFKRGGREPVL